MRISVKALALALGLVWGGGIAFVGLVHLAVPGYGTAFLEFTSSIYPGFHAARSFGDALVGIAWGLADGAGGGADLRVGSITCLPDVRRRAVQPDRQQSESNVPAGVPATIACTLLCRIE